MAYILPSVLVYQEFDLVPAALLDTLRAHISGPHAYVLRHADPDERALSYLGAYDPFNDLVSPWPQRPPGATVDSSYTKVYIDKAKLKYYEDLIGGAGGGILTPVAINKISSDSTTQGFKANGAAYPRFTALFDRDVQPGDRVHIRGVGVADSQNYELDTYVTAIESDKAAAVVDATVPAASNGVTQTASVTPLGGVKIPPLNDSTTTITVDVDFSAYDSLADGAMSDVYTIVVTRSSVGAVFTTAEVRITTASGKDDDVAVIPNVAGTPFDVGKRGLKLNFKSTNVDDDLIVNQTFQATVKCAYTAVTGTSSGTYRGAQSTTYVIEIVKGGKVGTTPATADPATCPQFRASTTLGTDSSQAMPILATGVAYPVGTQGVMITFGATTNGIRNGDRFYVDVVSAQDGVMSTLVLGHNLPSQLVLPTPAVDLDLTLYIERDIMVDEIVGGMANWEQSTTQITVHGGAEAYDEEFTAGGEPRPLPVESGLVYVEYRAWLSDLTSTVGTISDVGVIDDAISGPLSPDNPLKWGVYKALANSNGSEVKFTAVADPTSLDSWLSVLELLVGRDDVYNLVPLTFDREVLDLYAAHVEDESAPEQARWRAVFAAIRAKTQDAVVSAATSADQKVVLAIISEDPVTTTNILLTVPDGNANFLTNNVRSGDVVRTGYGIDNGVEIFAEYVIDQVVNEDSLRLMSGPDAPITVAQKIEIWRHLNRDEIATDLAQQAGSFSSRRVKAVWPDTVGSAGVLQEGYYLACALAGLRSGVVPHQGLTNVQVRGFDDLSRTTDFLGGAQLNTMAEAGTWIVTQSPDGTVYTRHALTTDNTDVNSSEEMITSNLDSISYLFSRRLAPYIGKMNVTQSAMLVLGTEIDSTIDFLKANNYVTRLGGQLVDGTILSLQPHSLLKDRVVCVIDITLPYPMNNLELHLVV